MSSCIYYIVPTPTVTANTNIADNVLAGDDVELRCAVTLPNYSASVYGNLFTVTVTWDRGVGSRNYAASMGTQTFSRTLSNVATSGSGVYTCTAQVIFTGSQSNVFNSDVSSGATTTLNVKSNYNFIILHLLLLYCMYSSSSYCYLLISISCCWNTCYTNMYCQHFFLCRSEWIKLHDTYSDPINWWYSWSCSRY